LGSSPNWSTGFGSVNGFGVGTAPTGTTLYTSGVTGGVLYTSPITIHISGAGGESRSRQSLHEYKFQPFAGA
jgi:hypothetical protein